MESGGGAPSGDEGGRAPSGGSRGFAPEAEKLFPSAHPAEAANLSYFLFICSILHVQVRTDFSAHNDVVISRYWHAPRLWSVCLGQTCIVTLPPHGKVNPI